MSEEQKPQPESQPTSSDTGSDNTLIPFVTQAFTNLYNRLDAMVKELELLKTAISQIDKISQTHLESIEPKFDEILSSVREQRRSSVTHYSQLAASVAQGFEELGELRSASADEQTLELLEQALVAVQDALYCLRMERLIHRFLGLREELPPKEED